MLYCVKGSTRLMTTRAVLSLSLFVWLGGFGGASVASNPFSAPQASPGNPFQAGGTSGAAFGGASSAFGGNGGGDTGSGRGFGGSTFGGSGRGRGGRNSGRGIGGRSGRGAPSMEFGGAAGGRGFSGRGGRGRGAANEFGGSSSPFNGGGRGGYGAASSGNPFAASSGAPSFGEVTSSPASKNFGSGAANNSHTSFGGASSAPFGGKRSDFGGRGPRVSAPAFGDGSNAPLPGQPPLPPPSPRLPGAAFGKRSGPGRGAPPGEFASAGSPTTSFGQGGGVARQKKQVTPTFVSVANDNPFASHPTTGGTTFGQTGQDFSVGPRAGREKRNSKPFNNQSEFVAPAGLEARMGPPPNAGSFKSKQRMAPQTALGGAATVQDSSFVTPRRKSFGASDQDDGTTTGFARPSGGLKKDSTEGNMTLKVKKKMMRSSPPPALSPSPPPDRSPASSPVRATGGYAVIGDDANKAELATADNLDGTCIDMCSPAERELHIRVDELSLFEKCFPGQPGMERELIVKRFQRSSADHKLDVPSEIRPSGVLRFTQLYIEQHIMDREKLGDDPRFNPPRVPELIELYNFCWDRCRMIRKDFVLQNYRGGGRVNPIVIDVHERIARYHILSEHELCEVPSFVAQQNTEQLGQTLKSLNELYDECRKQGDPALLSPFEAEFRAYFILCTVHNRGGMDVLKFVKGLAPQVRESEEVKFAMRVFVARHTEDYYLFFKLLREATYLRSCLMFRYLASMRSMALQRMNRAYARQSFSLLEIVDMLCFDDLDHALAVCTQHGLDVVAEREDDDESYEVKFGGEFETDVQLRQNKNPLPVRSSHVYIGQKQGDFWRKDICRGVTEYAPDQYPILSKLIEDIECEERAALYPNRRPYEDEYSNFVLYTDDPYGTVQDKSFADRSWTPSTLAGPSMSSKSSTEYHRESDVEDRPTHTQEELEAIKRQKEEVARARMETLKRIEMLEREKQAREEAIRQKEMSAKLALQQAAEAKAKQEAEILQRKRDEELQLQNERRRLQQEKEDEARKAVEKKLHAERARQDQLKKEAEAKAREEEVRRREDAARREREAQQRAREEAERQRQAQRAAEAARLKREAELEARKREEEARELARQKKLRQVQKQRLAVLKLRFHLWKSFVAESKAIPTGLKVDPTAFFNEEKPNRVLEWLFRGDPHLASRFGAQRRHRKSTADANSVSGLDSLMWTPIDVASVVGESLQQSGFAPHGWKLVIADLLDEGLSSFGGWCAFKMGISGAVLSDDEQVSTVHYTQWYDGIVPICCRYVDASFHRTLSGVGQSQRLAGASAFILPLDLSHVVDGNRIRRWQERVEGMLVHLQPSSQVSLVVLAYTSKAVSDTTQALSVAENVIRSIQARFVKNIVHIDGELLVEASQDAESDGYSGKISAMLLKLAKLARSPPQSVSVGFAELLDRAIQNALNRATDGLVEITSALQQEFASLRDFLCSEVKSLSVTPIPELEDALGLPAHDWDSPESQRLWDRVLRTLSEAHVHPDTVPSTKDQVCESYFKKVCHLVDTLFALPQRAAKDGTLSIEQLKETIYQLLLEVHGGVKADRRGAQEVDGSKVLPWRYIFESVYGALVEVIENPLLLVPADFEVRMERKHNHVVHPRRKPGGRLDAAAIAAAVAFAKQALKRSPSHQLVAVEEKRQVKRLRKEIEKNRAASQHYQQFLRRALQRPILDEVA